LEGIRKNIPYKEETSTLGASHLKKRRGRKLISSLYRAKKKGFVEQHANTGPWER